MTASKSVDRAGSLREQLESASPDLLRAMVKTGAGARTSAATAALALCCALGDRRASSRQTVRAHGTVAGGQAVHPGAANLFVRHVGRRQLCKGPRNVPEHRITLPTTPRAYWCKTRWLVQAS